MPKATRTFTTAATIGIALIATLTLAIPRHPAHAEAPVADSYEPNDTLETASNIPNVVTLPNLTIYPASDQDFYRILAVPGPLKITAYATPGLDLELAIYNSSGEAASVINDPASPNVSFNTAVAATGYFVFKLRSTTPFTGFYQLDISNATPTPQGPASTPTPIPTVTPYPTATAPYPANTPTPDLGGKPDYAEPNYSFNTAYRIAPGTSLDNLNFNSGIPGQKDNDFFVMAVRAGVSYTCRTANLSPSLDTNLIVYYSANFDDIAGGNDDENIQAGLINSSLTFPARADGDVYILVGYKFPASEDLRYPGAATYTLSCDTAKPAPSGGAGSGSPIVYGTPHATPISIVLFQQPNPTATPTVQPIKPMTIDVVVAYDRNADRKADPAEGVSDLAIHVVDTVTNQELTWGLTDTNGSLHFILATNHPLRVSIPYLAAAQDFQPGSPGQWLVLVPPANIPGLVP